MSKVVENGEIVTFSLTGDSDNEYSIWLPTSPGLGLVAIEAAEGARILPAQSPQLRWAFYGSSITHGTGMPPALIWPSLLSRHLNYEPYNFGFDGNALLEIEVAEDIVKSHPHRVTLELGINCFLVGAFREKDIIPVTERFLEVFAKNKAEYPIDVLTPFRAPRYERSKINGVTLRSYRSAIETAARGLDLPNVHVIDGTTLLKPTQDLFSDGLHPSIEGHETIAKNYSLMARSHPFSTST